MQAILALADGSVFYGKSIGATGQRCGELIFNTAMSGYQETLTNPSYAGQILTLTYPHIGNTGINALDAESGAIHAAALVVRDIPTRYSSWRAEGSLSDYLKAQGVPAIAGVDTREITRRLRTHGSQNACLLAGENIDETTAVNAARQHPSMQGQALATAVAATAALGAYTQESGWSLAENRFLQQTGDFHVVAFDFGIKSELLRQLASAGCRITVVPPSTTAEAALALNPDGIFFSNGPGDPAPLQTPIATIRNLLQKDIPLFGIGLGHQLLALAAGGEILKLPFGHHGANHPVRDLGSGRVWITAQHHNFAVDARTLPEEIEITHRSLFDDSLQGIAWKERPFFGFQGYPGAHDGEMLFGRFVALMRTRQRRG